MNNGDSISTCQIYAGVFMRFLQRSTIVPHRLAVGTLYHQGHEGCLRQVNTQVKNLEFYTYRTGGLMWYAHIFMTFHTTLKPITEGQVRSLQTVHTHTVTGIDWDLITID